MKKLIFILLILPSLSFLPSCKNKVDYTKLIVSCMGDSITYGHDPAGGGQLKETYPSLLENNMNFKKVYNNGISGSTVSICPDGGYQPMVNRIKEIDINSNVIIVWGSGNDYRHDFEIGEEGNTDSSTYYGALYNICSFLETNFRDAFKMFITSLPCRVDGIIYKLNSLKGAIEYTCNKFNIPFLNFTDDSGFEEEIESGKNDGIHPSQEFVKDVIVPKIADFLKTHL